jgi:two-component system, cell cycle sensor histidine kinase and response regulator CckA
LSKRRVSFPVRQLPVVAMVCAGILAAILCCIHLRSREAEDANAAFCQAAQKRFDNLQGDLDLSISKVVALGTFCDTSRPVTRVSFESFTAPLLSGYDPGIQAIEWIPRVDGSLRGAFEKSVRAEGFKGFEIRERLPSGSFVRANNRSVYFPVVYIAPLADNGIAEGYDGQGRRREALLLASSNGELTASPRVSLVQENANQYGVLIFLPVFRKARGSSDTKELEGFAAGVLRVGRIVEKHGGSGVALAVSDVTDGSATEQIYTVDSRPLPTSVFTQQRRIALGGRSWLLTATPMPGAFTAAHTFSYAVSSFVFTVMMLLTGYVANARDRRWEVERLVEERTRALNTALTSLAKTHCGLEESEARYRRLVEDSPGAILVQRQGQVIFANHVALEMFNVESVAQMQGRSVFEFIPPEYSESAEDRLRQLESRPVHLPSRETRLVRSDGKTLEVEIASSSFFHNGSIVVQSVVHDISQRKQDEAVNARLIRAIEQVGDSIVISDPDGRIVYVNPAFERTSGYGCEEVLGQNPRFLSSGRHSAEFYAQLWSSIQKGESWSGRFINRAKDGHLYTEEAIVSPILSQSGQIINYVAVKHDITREIELHEQLHQSQKMDAIGRLAGGVAHDFNNMLMVIFSYAELIANALPEDHPGQDYTAQILSAAQRSSALTRQLLAFSRKQVLTRQVLDCNIVITEISSMVRRLISETITLQCDLAPDLWPVKADTDQVAQVILNLCVNSRDAMPDGGVLTLTTRNCQLDQRFVEISVSDTGVGISPELLEKLFEPFFTTKAPGKGTGLGLATVYGIVQQSGGTIHVDSSPGHGATFTIQLPCCLEKPSRPELPLDKPHSVGASRILVVEDEDALREAMTEHLCDHGYQVLASSDGLQALELLSRNPDISILVTDLVMPRMGGRQLARLALTHIPHLQVIFMCGYTDQVFNAQQDAPALFLQKPFTMNHLLTRIAELSIPPTVIPSSPDGTSAHLQ